MSGRGTIQSRVPLVIWLPLSLLIVVASFKGPAIGREEKGQDSEFTALQALQRATEILHRLVEKGKLDPTWETGLMRAVIRQRIREDMTEYVVSFRRARGDPSHIYLYFTESGHYEGSDFIGD